MIFKSLLLNLAKKVKVKKMYKMNYSDQIIRSLVVTTFVKKKFNILFMMLNTIIIRTVISFILCCIFTYNLYIDFFLHSIISIIVVLNSHFIYDILKAREEKFYKITKYVVNNYTIENYRRWKRNIMLSISSILIVILLFSEITSNLLIYYIIQNLFTYGIIDIIEHKKLNKLLKTIKEKPKETKFSELTILEDYYDLDKQDFKTITNIKENDEPINENFLVVKKDL